LTKIGLAAFARLQRTRSDSPLLCVILIVVELLIVNLLATPVAIDEKPRNAGRGELVRRG
jgi:hypothetical protein